MSKLMMKVRQLHELRIVIMREFIETIGPTFKEKEQEYVEQ